MYANNNCLFPFFPAKDLFISNVELQEDAERYRYFLCAGLFPRWPEGQGWARLKSWSCNSTQIYYVGVKGMSGWTVSHYPPRCTNRELDQKWSQPDLKPASIRDADIVGHSSACWWATSSPSCLPSFHFHGKSFPIFLLSVYVCLYWWSEFLIGNMLLDLVF